METSNLLEQFDEVGKKIEFLRKSSPRYIDYSSNNRTRKELIQAILHNKSIEIDSEGFRQLITMQKNIADWLLDRYSPNLKAKRLLEGITMGVLEDDEEDKDDSSSGNYYLACPSGYSGIIRKYSFGEEVCSSDSVHSACDNCQYNPED